MNVQFAGIREVILPAVASPVLWACTIGRRVPRKWSSGRVETVFERACNIVTASGEFLAILSAEAGNVAHGIRLCQRLPLSLCARAGARAQFDGGRITFAASQLAIDLSRATVWESELRLGMVNDVSRLARSAARARRLLMASAKQSASEFLKIALRVDVPDTPLAAVLGAMLVQLGVAQRTRNSKAALRIVDNLLGLGPGLTPAGDDFVIGWLAGLTLAAADPASRQFLREMCDGISARRHVTTMVSAQHLDDASYLCFSEHLSNLCVAIAGDGCDSLLCTFIAAQLSIGATSGADGVAGLMFALSDVGDADPWMH